MLIIRRSFVIALMSSVPTSTALAGNDEEVILGRDSAIVGGAVTATVSDASALVYEPSGLSEGDDDTIDANVSAINLRFHHFGAILTTPTDTRSTSNVEFVQIPATLAYTRTISDHVRMGLGVFATNGYDLRAEDQFESPLGSATSRYAIRLDQSSTTYLAAAGLGISVGDHVHVGFALGIHYATYGYAFRFTANRSLDAALPTDPPIVTDYFTQVDDTAWDEYGVRVTAGFRYVANEHFRMALSLTSPTVAIGASYAVTELAEGYSDRTNPATVSHEQSAVDDFQAGGGFLAPGRIRLGFAASAGSWTISLDGDFTGRLDNDFLAVYRTRNGNVRVGARCRLSDAYDVGFGFFTDRSASALDDGTRDPYAQDFYGGTMGLVKRKVRRLSDDEPDRELHFVSSYAIRYAYGRSTTSGYIVPDDFDLTDTSGFGIRDSTQTSHELAVYLGSSLSF